MAVGLNRASIFAIKKEVTSGEYLAPTVGSEFVPLRSGNELSFEPEILESDELLNDIGASKGSIGKESVSGSHTAYLKHSGVEGQEPELGVLYESIMGSKYVVATEYDTVAGSTTSLFKVNTGEGAQFRVGQALLVKDATNGYSIRNVESISGDDLTLNFRVGTAPAAGVNLGKAVLYIPAAQGHPTFSTTKYLGNGFAIESSAGNTVTELSVTTDANTFGEVEFSFEGTKYFYNSITLTSTTNKVTFTDDAGTFTASIPVKTYSTPIDLAAAIELGMNAVSTEDYTVVYSSSTGKFTFTTATSAIFTLSFGTGTDQIASKIGFNNTNLTGALTYTSQNELTYNASLTPSYDAAENIIIKGAELFVGNTTDNVCICAQSVSLTVSKEVEDVDCICEETGVSEKIPTSRTAEMQVTATLKKHDAALLDALLKNKGVKAMLNCGPKVAGNWVAGKCANFYMANCTVSAYKTTGDSFLQVELTLKGYVTTTSKDIYLNFV